MLTGGELAIAIAAILFGAVGLGALLHWLWARSRPGRSDEAARLARVGEALHEAEMKREAADLALREAEERLDRRELEFNREISDTWSELDATHAALVEARERVRELEAELERLRGGV